MNHSEECPVIVGKESRAIEPRDVNRSKGAGKTRGIANGVGIEDQGPDEKVQNMTGEKT
jgi:hypothetical protein